MVGDRLRQEGIESRTHLPDTLRPVLWRDAVEAEPLSAARPPLERIEPVEGDQIAPGSIEPGAGLAHGLSICAGPMQQDDQALRHVDQAAWARARSRATSTIMSS